MSVLTACLFGLAFGSFANAAIDRWPHISLVGRSHCDACGRILRAHELIPIVSYLMLRGRCRTCDATIGVRTPVVEATCTAGFCAAALALAAPFAVAACAVFIAGVIAVGTLFRKRGEVHV